MHVTSSPQSDKYFGNSTGLMGSYFGQLLARDGVTTMEDTDAFSQEWQVTNEEPKLFRTNMHPQYPHKCLMPSPKTAGQRRLGETIAKNTAEEACSHLSGKAFDNCVYDVMKIGDVEIAEASV